MPPLNCIVVVSLLGVCAAAGRANNATTSPSPIGSLFMDRFSLLRCPALGMERSPAVQAAKNHARGASEPLF